ncbi:CAP domain-containing protein [Nonomuraea lactucae]|uniref:CAP domain-containing protein n=1 Tax=Nonomuraea lactucae TaxID=2249762 RepID=UPI0013B42B77|nr:CAP domain-containing protein [Nonomuraea lactucae]
MRRRLQALACLGGLAVLVFPTTPAQAPTTQDSAPIAEVSAADSLASVPDGGASAPLAKAAAASRKACRIVAAKPVIARGSIRGAVTRVGCGDRTRLRVRINKVLPGPDRTVKSGSRVVTNGRIVASVRCVRTPARYYVVGIDLNGPTAKSRSVKLSCKVAPPTENTEDSGASSVEEAVVQLTNAARARNGCKALVHDPKLHAAAERHSADMAARRYFDHESPDGRDPGDRVRAAGFAPIRTWGENIAMGQRTAADVVQGWLDSPGHRANIMNCAFTHIGVGHVASGPYWTQVFAAH